MTEEASPGVAAIIFTRECGAVDEEAVGIGAETARLPFGASFESIARIRARRSETICTPLLFCAGAGADWALRFDARLGDIGIMLVPCCLTRAGTGEPAAIAKFRDVVERFKVDIPSVRWKDGDELLRVIPPIERGIADAAGGVPIVAFAIDTST